MNARTYKQTNKQKTSRQVAYKYAQLYPYSFSSICCKYIHTCIYIVTHSYSYVYDFVALKDP